MSVASRTDGSFENEDRSTKHPKLENEAPYLENEAPKTRKRRPLNLENEAPKTRKGSTLDRKRSTQKLETGSVLYKHETNANTAGIKHDNESNSPFPHHGPWSQAVILEQILPGSADLI